MMIPVLLIGGFIVYYMLRDGECIKHGKKTDVEELLKIRYVNGEIDDETYQRMIKIIKD